MVETVLWRVDRSDSTFASMVVGTSSIWMIPPTVEMTVPVVTWLDGCGYLDGVQQEQDQWMELFEMLQSAVA